MEFTTASFPPDPIIYSTPTWVQLHELTFQVAQQIYQEQTKGLPPFDRIVTLAKGGWSMTRALVDFLQVKEVASLGVRFYKGVDQRLEQPEVYQDLPISVKGERVLLFDDVADTGESLIFGQDYLRSRGVSDVKTAAVFYKPHSHLKPDFFGETTSNWIIFPYEIIESMKIITTRWAGQGALPERQDLESRFGQLGFSPAQIALFFERYSTPS